MERSERARQAAADRLRAQTARVAEIDADRESLRQQLHEARVREFALTRQGRPGTGGELRTADDEADHQQLRTPAKFPMVDSRNGAHRMFTFSNSGLGCHSSRFYIALAPPEIGKHGLSFLYTSKPKA